MSKISTTVVQYDCTFHEILQSSIESNTDTKVFNCMQIAGNMQVETMGRIELSLLDCEIPEARNRKDTEGGLGWDQFEVAAAAAA